MSDFGSSVKLSAKDIDILIYIIEEWNMVADWDSPVNQSISEEVDDIYNLLRSERSLIMRGRDVVGLVYDESYGELSVDERKAIKKFNVSPSEHQDLCDDFGENNHSVITETILQRSSTGMYQVKWGE